MTAGNAAAIGSSEGQAADIKLVAAAISELGRFVDDLIERREDIVGKLDFRYRRHTVGSQAVGKAGNPLLGEWSIEAALTAKLFL